VGIIMINCPTTGHGLHRHRGCATDQLPIVTPGLVCPACGRVPNGQKKKPGSPTEASSIAASRIGRSRVGEE